MSGERRKEIVRHLSEDDLDRLLSEADEPKVLRRLAFVKNLYEGDTLEEAASRVGKSASTGSRWARRWNEGGLERLMPDLGDGRPPKLTEDEQDELLELLRDGQPWIKQEIQDLLKEEFDVEYHPVYLNELLHNLGLSYSTPRTNRHSQPSGSEGSLDEGQSDEPYNRHDGDSGEGWVVDDDTRTDGGTAFRSVDAPSPDPCTRSHRM
jgi:transposase